ncbi:hypothetical protein ACWG5P_25385 [Streptomyces prasinus]
MGRLVLAAAPYTRDGVHEEVRIPDHGSPRLPGEADFRETAAAYAVSAPYPEHFGGLLATCPAAAHAPLPWTADDLRGLTAPTLLVIGDTGFVRVEHAAEVQRLSPRSRPAVLPATPHLTLLRRTSLLPPLPDEFVG